LNTQSSCENCPLKPGRRVGSRGDITSPIAIVGEAPGRRELARGRPFIGPSGELLDRSLPLGVSLDDFFVTNASSCRPLKSEGDAKLLIPYIESCRDRLITELQEHPRKVVIAMGNAAMWSLTKNYKLAITRTRGKLLVCEDLPGTIIFPILHPAFLLRGGGNYRQFLEDLEYAIELGKGGAVRHAEEPTYITLRDDNEINDAINRIHQHDIASADIETTGLNPREDRILCLGVCYNPKEVIIFDEKALANPLTKRLFKGKTQFVWHNGKFDVSFLRRDGFKVSVEEDTMLQSYCLNENTGLHDLEQISNNLLGAEDYKWMVKDYLPWNKKATEYAPPAILHPYLSYDCSNTLQVHGIYRKRVSLDPNLEKLYTKTLIPANDLLLDVEKNGMYIDRTRLDRLNGWYEKKIEIAKAAFDEFAPGVSPTSPKQLSILFFDQLGFKPVKKRSTDKDFLKKYKDRPIIKALKEVRKLSKAYGTNVKAIYRHIEADGRVHSSFKLHGSKTGRLASNDPNAQNIPRDPHIRGMITAEKGNILIEADLNQAELRSLAALSGCDALCEIYTTPGHPGLHHEVSVHYYGENYTHEDKMKAKGVNFGIVYGRTAWSLAEEYGYSIAEGLKYIKGWFDRFPGAHDYIMKCRATPLRRQLMVTVFGRKKRLGVVSRANLRDLQNEAANFPHQSIASDFTLHAAMSVRKALARLGVKIINLVHDSILVECRNEPALIEKVKFILIEAMEAQAPLWGITRVPFIAEAKVGFRWGSLKDSPRPEGLKAAA